MTDPELIELVQNKLPEDLSPEQIAAVRARLADLPQLQLALADQISMEEYLCRALGRVEISIDNILATASSSPPPVRGIGGLIGWAFCVGIVFVTFSVLLFVSTGTSTSEPNAAVASAIVKKPVSRAASASMPKVQQAGGRAVDRPVVKPRGLEIAETPVKPAVDSGKPQSATSAAVASGPVPVPASATAAPTIDRAPATKQNAPQPQAQRQAPVAQQDPRTSKGPERGDPPPLPAKEPAPAEASPWPELADTAPVRRLADSAFDDEGPQRAGVGAAELKRWLTAIPGHPHEFLEAQRSNRQVAAVSGLLKLRAPWRGDAVLTFAPYDCDAFALNFWSGDTGVAFRFYPSPRKSWGAYRLQRKGSDLLGQASSLIGTDNERYDRTGAGCLEVRHQNGTLVLSRGDIRLLTVPFASLPAEVYLENRTWFSMFTMYRGEPLAEEPLPPRRNVLASSSPARLEWTLPDPAGAAAKKPDPGPRFTKLDDGGVELRVEQSPELVGMSTSVPAPGLQEFIFQVEQADAGTGVYLGDDAGRPLYKIAFSRFQQTNRTTFGLQRQQDRSTDSNFDVRHQVTPLAAERQWLRMIVGCGNVKCWTSGDGIHWGRAGDPLRDQRGAYSRVGIFCQNTHGPCGLKLKLLQIRELTPLLELAPVDVRKRVPAALVTGDLEMGSWLARVIESQPADVDPAAWRAACALGVLAAGPPAGLGNALLAGLLEERLRAAAPVEKKLQLLDDAALLFDAWDYAGSYQLSQLYEKLGMVLVTQGESRPYSSAGHALLTSPMATSAVFQTFPEALVAAELWPLVYADRWSDVRGLCRRLIYWNRASHPESRWPDHRARLQKLVEWADASALRLVDKSEKDVVKTLFPANWRHPLIVELSKDGYNTLAEIEAALAEKSFSDACQIITTTRPEAAVGLLPDGNDPKLALSLPQAVAGAMRDHPALRQTMIDQFGKLAKLRVQQAIADANPIALQGATNQFYGTDAATEAHQWLGDRALSGGDFGTAVAEYEAGLRGAADSQRPGISARLRLAAAMLGRDQGSPANEPVVFGDTQFSAGEFEALITEMRENAAGSGASRSRLAEAAGMSRPVIVNPAAFELKSHPRVGGDLGANVGNIGNCKVDWVARQLSCKLVDDVFYVSNRFQLAAFETATGQMKWSQALGGNGEAHRWPLLRMPPVIAGDRIFIRRLANDGPELLSVQTATGKILWHSKPGEQIASDPMLIQDELLALIVSTSSEGMLQLDLAHFNSTTGEVVARKPVIRLRDAWERQLPCSAMTKGGHVYITVGGSVLCCDLLGHPLWVRRQTWVPASQEISVADQPVVPPLLADGRLYVLQPGVFTVECLDSESGRRLWQNAYPGLRRILGLAQGRVFVETSRGVQAAAADTGKVLWTQAVDQLLDAHLVGVGQGDSPGTLLLARRARLQPDVSCPRLVWLDAATGRETGSYLLDQLTDKQPQFGPIIQTPDRCWAFFGRGDRDGGRDMVELARTSKTPLPEVRGTALEGWMRGAPVALQQSAVTVALPGWTYLGQVQDGRTGYRAEYQGETQVGVSLASRDRPATFLRQVTLPRDSHAKLSVQVGYEGGQKSELEIRVSGVTVRTEALEPPPGASGWQELQIDLTPFAGKTFWLMVEQRSDAGAVYGYWKRLDILE